MRCAVPLLACALLFSSAGCAHLLRQYDLAPNGLPREDARVRDWLAGGRADTALVRLTGRDFGPGDELLRLLFLGSAAHYAEEHERSFAFLEKAAELAEDRATKSVSRAALSLVSNDLILPYVPSRTERLFIPYYAALGRLRIGDVEGAAVEARRLSALLQKHEDSGWRGDTGLHATLRYLTGVIFDAAGERDDALVAFRNTAALADGLVSPSDTAWTARWTSAAPADTAAVEFGDVVVFVENGYVAHRTGEAFYLLLTPHEVAAFTESDASGRASLATLLADRVLSGDAQPRRLASSCTWGSSCSSASKPAETTSDADDDEDRDPFLLKLAWPVMRPTYRALPVPELGLGGATLSLHDLGDVSRAAIADFEAERPLIVARTIARAAVKTALTKGASGKTKDKDETAGRIVGVLANAGSVLLEQADTRSWHLLPARLSAARVRVPAGRQGLTVTVRGRTVDLGSVDVPANGIAITSTRVW